MTARGATSRRRNLYANALAAAAVMASTAGAMTHQAISIETSSSHPIVESVIRPGHKKRRRSRRRRHLQVSFTFEDLPVCNQTSLELSQVEPYYQEIAPCILYDIQPPDGSLLSSLSNNLQGRNKSNTTNLSSSSTSTTTNGARQLQQQVPVLVTLVQVTPTFCTDHRDGAALAVQTLNQRASSTSTHVYRLVSVIAGNPASFEDPEDGYGLQHSDILESMLQSLPVDFIVGTCSFTNAKTYERRLATLYQRILTAQVGPPSYYSSQYVFGIHVNSNNYAIPALRQLSFSYISGQSTLQNVQVKVIYRTQSEFFASTCGAAVQEARQLGFKSVEIINYNPFDDHDQNGLPNQWDVPFLKDLATNACSATHGNDHPALFVCVSTNVELETFLRTWKEGGCRPSLLWATPVTWNRAVLNDPQEFAYMMGSGQWHISYSPKGDAYFSSGQGLLLAHERKFGYEANYNMVVSYSIVMLYEELLKESLQQTTNNYEQLRQLYSELKADTMLGPVSFDRNQQNIASDVASIQWLPIPTLSMQIDNPDLSTIQQTSLPSKSYYEALVSPILKAEALMVIPCPDATACPAGQFHSQDTNNTNLNSTPALLTSKCILCPLDTYNPTQSNSTTNHECLPCPEGSSTEGRTGATTCVKQNAQLLPLGIQVLGFCIMGLVWSAAFLFMGWCIYYKLDPVVIIGQFQFLIVICVGAVLSSSTIIPLSFQADIGESTWAATVACRAAPFLYTTGWVLEYSSLSAKTFRLYRLMGDDFRRRTIHARDMYAVIAAPLILDFIIVLTWTLVDPLTYVRVPTGIVQQSNGLIILESAGRCESQKYPSWVWIVPLLILHLGLMVTTNVLLYQVRNVATRYQEQKHVGLASLLVLEVFLVGIPILFAVKDNPTASYFVFLGIILLNDLSILSCIFGPKVWYQKKGLPSGVSVADTLRQTPGSVMQRRSSLGVCSSLDGIGGFGQDTVEAMRRRSSLLSSSNSNTGLISGHNAANGSRTPNSMLTRSLSGVYRPEMLNERDGITRSRPSGRLPTAGRISRDPLVRTRRGHAGNTTLLTRSLVGRHERSIMQQLNRSRVGLRAANGIPPPQAGNKYANSNSDSKTIRFGPFTGELAKALKAAAAMADSSDEEDEEKSKGSHGKKHSRSQRASADSAPSILGGRQSSNESFSMSTGRRGSNERRFSIGRRSSNGSVASSDSHPNLSEPGGLRRDSLVRDKSRFSIIAEETTREAKESLDDSERPLEPKPDLSFNKHLDEGKLPPPEPSPPQSP